LEENKALVIDQCVEWTQCCFAEFEVCLSTGMPAPVAVEVVALAFWDRVLRHKKSVTSDRDRFHSARQMLEDLLLLRAVRGAPE
jgi:hypothetical protein